MRSKITLLLILTVTIVCYFPGLTGSFIFDDLTNIRQNPNLAIQHLDFSSLWVAATSGGAGIFKRPISMASFAINYYLTGWNSYYFKLTNLGIHLINGILVFSITNKLLNLYLRIRQEEQQTLSAEWIALAVSAAWLLHPFNLTGVLYVVQRMTSLATFFTLVGILMYLIGRKSLIDGKRSGLLIIAIAIIGVTPLAVLSKESGALLPLFILVTELTMFQRDTTRLNKGRSLPLIVALPALVSLLIAMWYVFNHSGFILAGYSWRDFSLTDRLMTEPRILWFYIRMTLLPSMTEMGLHHDDISISRNLFLPLTTLPAIFGLLMLSVGAILLRRRYPLISFGIGFFLVGHLLESSVIPLEIAFEHRNYLPMFGILLPIIYYILQPIRPIFSLQTRVIFFLVMLVSFAGITAVRSSQWGDPFMMRVLEAERHPNSVRANTDIAALYDHILPISNSNALELYNKAIFHYQKAADVAPSRIDGLVGLLAANAERGIQPESTLIQALEYRLATVPFGPPNKNTFIGLIRCVRDNACQINFDLMNRFYIAALSNPTLVGDHRDQIIMEFNQLSAQMKLE